MAETIRIRVLTDAGVALDEQAVSVVAPGEVGYLGMLRNHAPLVTTLAPGILRWKTPQGDEKRVSIGPGLLEITNNRLTLLVSTLEEPIVSRT